MRLRPWTSWRSRHIAVSDSPSATNRSVLDRPRRLPPTAGVLQLPTSSYPEVTLFVLTHCGTEGRSVYSALIEYRSPARVATGRPQCLPLREPPARRLYELLAHAFLSMGRRPEGERLGDLSLVETSGSIPISCAKSRFDLPPLPECIWRGALRFAVNREADRKDRTLA